MPKKLLIVPETSLTSTEKSCKFPSERRYYSTFHRNGCRRGNSCCRCLVETPAPAWPTFGEPMDIIMDSSRWVLMQHWNLSRNLITVYELGLSGSPYGIESVLTLLPRPRLYIPLWHCCPQINNSCGPGWSLLIVTVLVDHRNWIEIYRSVEHELLTYSVARDCYLPHCCAWRSEISAEFWGIHLTLWQFKHHFCDRLKNHAVDISVFWTMGNENVEPWRIVQGNTAE